MRFRQTLVAVALVAALPAGAQQMYRCGNSFSQQPCVQGQQVRDAHGVPKPLPPLKDTPRSPAIEEAAKAMCLARLQATLKDPESMRVGKVLRIGPEYIEVRNADGSKMTPAVHYALEVNARNSNGGYTGMRLYHCKMDPTETIVLRVE